MRGLIEKIESWIWIRPIPSKLEKQDDKNQIYSGCLPLFICQRSRRRRHNSVTDYHAESNISYPIYITKKASINASSNVKKFCLFPSLFTKSDEKNSTKVLNRLPDLPLVDSEKHNVPDGCIFTDIFKQRKFRRKINWVDLVTVFRGNCDEQMPSFNDPVKVLPFYGFHYESLHQDLHSDEFEAANNWGSNRSCSVTFGYSKRRIQDNKMTEMVNKAADPVSDSEDDPGKLLNAWLGELDSLKKGLDSPSHKNGNGEISSVENSPMAHTPNGVNGAAVAPLPPVLRRRNNMKPEVKQNVQYRRSLINLEDATQDDELDAILGELSVLGSQLEEEMDQKLVDAANAVPAPTSKDSSPDSSGNSDDNSNSSGVHSRSSSGEGAKVANSLRPVTNGKRTDSPDNDSAFCDNLSVLSSCSASSSSKIESKTSSSGVSSSASPSTAIPPAVETQDEEARIKAEKIKLAIEKIKEASVKKIFIKVFAADGSAKSLLVDEKMSVGFVTRILAEKNHVKLHPKWAIVELIPELYMERVYEDHENLVENCLMWKVDSKNTLWFIERPEKFDLFSRPELYLLGSSSSQKGDLLEEHARQELLEEYFSSSGVGAPEGVEGFVWLKSESKKSWKKFFFVLRSSGLYYAPKGRRTSKDLVCLATFDVNQVYYGSNWKKKYKSPTDFCFAIKHPQIQAKSPKYIRYLCVESEREMHQWVTAIRIAKNGKTLFDNYRGIEEEITHADIDILTSKRFSVNSPSGNKQNQPQVPNLLQVTPIAATSPSQAGSSPARTPLSENKSFDSALSSGIVSDSSLHNSNKSVSGCSNSVSGEEPEVHDEVTPVNTIQRATTVTNGQNSVNHINDLRRSVSRLSKSSTSSSSGCLSDKSSGSGQPFVPNGLGNNPEGGHNGGFDSDHPLGGTIKKRPSAAAMPKIPLTNTTWGLVARDSDNDDNDDDESSASCSGDSTSNSNVQIGRGGTLLRSGVRQSLRKTSIENNRTQQQVMAQVHAPGSKIYDVIQAQQDLVDPLSQQFESSMITSISDELPLPPPPRAESVQQFNLHLSQNDVDDLPPPPPPEVCDQMQKQLPKTLPSASSMKGASDAPRPKRISFDDKVQLIPEREEVDDHRVEEPKTRYFFKREKYTAKPKKLFSGNEGAGPFSTPPKEFLKDLQRVMNKKWQVAEKFKETKEPNGQYTSPHRYFGFEDAEINGVQQDYSKDASVGRWLLSNQQFAESRIQAEPLYAASAKRPNLQHHVTNNHVNHQQMINGGPTALPPHHPMANQKHYSPPLPPIRSNVPAPVVLREPTPEAENMYGRHPNPHCQPQPHPMVAQQQPMVSHQQPIYNHLPVQQMAQPPQPIYQDVNNIYGYQGQPQGLPIMNRGSPSHPMSQKRAPPPPRRSENTHLTSK